MPTSPSCQRRPSRRRQHLQYAAVGEPRAERPRPDGTPLPDPRAQAPHSEGLVLHLPLHAQAPICSKATGPVSWWLVVLLLLLLGVLLLLLVVLRLLLVWLLLLLLPLLLVDLLLDRGVVGANAGPNVPRHDRVGQASGEAPLGQLVGHWALGGLLQRQPPHVLVLLPAHTCEDSIRTRSAACTECGRLSRDTSKCSLAGLHLLLDESSCH